MLTSLEQLCNRYNIDKQQFNRIQIVCKPQQKSFISLVQWFGENKMLAREFNVDDFNIGHRLIPYGKETYGIYSLLNYNLYDFIGNLNTTYDGDRTDIGIPVCIIKFNKEEYLRAKDNYDKFWEWRKNRNVTRLAMEEEFNFDGKHAMHLVRLLRIGEEALTTGQILVKRPDAKELLEIRNGSWSYDELVKYADEKDNHIRNVLYKQTSLPKTPNYKLAAKLIMDIQDIMWSRND